MMREDWRGRIDAADGDSGRRWHQVVEPLDAAARAGVALLGFMSDEGVARNQGRTGALEGPRALRRALAPLAYHAGRGTPLYDAGDVACEDHDLEGAQATLGAQVAGHLGRGHFPMLLVVGRKETDRVEALLPSFSHAFQSIYNGTQEGMGQRWLLLDVGEDDALLDDACEIVRIRRESR